MNKEKIVLSVLCMILIFSFSLIIFNREEKTILTDNDLSIYLETEGSTGEYSLSDLASIPESGYELNTQKSTCKNGGTISWDNSTNTVSLSSSREDKCTLYFDLVNTAASFITNLFNQGSSDLADLDPDNNIRYAGKNPNNYVLFNNELWRIIGIFNNKLKIVREYYIPVVFTDNGVTVGDTSIYYSWGSTTGAQVDFFYWNYNGTNNWETSTLKNYLNGTYYNNLEQNSKNLVDEETWYLGGFNEFPTKASEIYKIERGPNVYSGNPLTTRAYIGLLYPSDIIYSKSSTSVPDYDYTFGYEGWWLCILAWLISSSSVDNQKSISYLADNGPPIFSKLQVNENDSGYAKYAEPRVYPTLYLKSTTTIISGDGTKENPYILS